ncbi:MAG: hypothetical protein ABS79_05040 [Planctomycetes bacterium SCN 63-9]|nr:MAG: hypothetical protein ABS79_05040 [Planctomycetes bacterium SCN 63-9]
MGRNFRRTRLQTPLGSHFMLEERLALSTVGVVPRSHAPAVVRNLAQASHRSNHAPQSQGGANRHFSHLQNHGKNNQTVAPTSRRWSWLVNTYWYVPTKNLSATLFNSSTGTLAPVSDQTVYHITGYRNGYFWGKTVTQIGSGSATSSSLVGSITPEGSILLTFTSTGGSSSPAVTEGFGKMVRKGHRWSMENQMFTSPSQTVQIGHWAYMMQTKPGMPSWRSLPGSGLSVPAFMSQFDGTAPQPIGP